MIFFIFWYIAVALTIAKRAVKNVDIQELTSRAMEVIVTKCGNIVYNLEDNFLDFRTTLLSIIF